MALGLYVLFCVTGDSPDPGVEKVSVKEKGCQVWRTEYVFKKGNEKWKQYEITKQLKQYWNLTK